MTCSYDVLDAYAWAVGDCFRCAKSEVPTAKVGEIGTPVGDLYTVRACEGCILEMEGERRRWAEQRGLEYEPGHLGAA